MIEGYLLEALQAVNEAGTLSAAAERLHVAEPSVSRSMKKLEGLLGVMLFERQKNKVVLNETGKLAAKYAEQVLQNEAEMVRSVRAFDRSQRAVTLGTCAPGPIMELLPALTGLYSDCAVSSEQESEERLIEGLDNAQYNLILLSHPIMQEGYCCRLYDTEQLCLSVPVNHPAATRESVTFQEMDGESFIMYARVGIWENIVRAKMPHARFFKQEDIDAVGELAASSELPSFTTDITRRVMRSRQNDRVNIPFSDPEAFVQFFLICREQDKARFKRLFERM